MMITEKEREPAPQTIAGAADVLALFDASMAAAGVAGERRNGRVLYLALTSRLLARPVNVALKGPPSGGKSFLVERVLAHFPDEAFVRVTGMSEKSLIYMGENVSHRHIVLTETAGAPGRLHNYFIRTLLSEGHIVWHTVERARDGSVSRVIHKNGPTGLIITSTGAEDKIESETRLLALSAIESSEQTRRVLKAVAGRQNGGEPSIDPAWPAFQAALSEGERRVVIPFATELAEHCAVPAVRMRRDFMCLLTLIEAHALLHRETRARDEEGRIVAEAKDYDSVRLHIADIFAESQEAAVSREIRRTVEAVRSIQDEMDRSVNAVARILKLTRWTASRRCRAAVRAGFILDTKEKSSQRSAFRLKDPMPADIEVLPPSLAPAPSVLLPQNDQQLAHYSQKHAN